MKRQLLPYILLCGVMVAAIIVCAFTTQGKFDPQYPVKTELPVDIDDYLGFSVYHCQSESCLKNFKEEELTDIGICPECGGKLDTVSLAEHQLLPQDTIILHRTYKSPAGMLFNVAVVIGGQERRSIHKPQVCIVGQGNAISGQRLIQIPIYQENKLDVMLMAVNQSKLYFAYWFTDGKHETARHLTRLFRTAWDGIIHNERRRWAYISVSVVNNKSRDALPELSTFISRLYSEINRINQLDKSE